MSKPVRLALTAVVAMIFLYLGVVAVGGGSAQDWVVETLKFGGAAVVAPMVAWLIKEHLDDEKQGRMEAKLDQTQREQQRQAERRG